MRLLLDGFKTDQARHFVWNEKHSVPLAPYMRDKSVQIILNYEPVFVMIPSVPCPLSIELTASKKRQYGTVPQGDLLSYTPLEAHGDPLLGTCWINSSGLAVLNRIS